MHHLSFAFQKLDVCRINVEDLDVVMPMYNTEKIIKNQQEVCGIIIEMNQMILFLLTLNLLNIRQVLQETLGAGEAGYDANKIGKNETEVVISLKHLSNFWRSLNIPLINCEVELILAWSKNCV